MTILKVSSKGQITIPIEIRETMGVKPHDTIVIEPLGDTAVLRRVRDFFEFEGFLGKALPPDEEQRLMEEGISRHVLGLDE